MLIPWNDDLLPILGSRLDMETVSIRGLLPAFVAGYRRKDALD